MEWRFFMVDIGHILQEKKDEGMLRRLLVIIGKR